MRAMKTFTSLMGIAFVTLAGCAVDQNGTGGGGAGTGSGGAGTGGGVAAGGAGGQAGATAVAGGRSGTGGRSSAGGSGGTGGLGVGGSGGASGKGGSTASTGGSGGNVADGGAADAVLLCDGVPPPDAGCPYLTPIWTCVPIDMGDVWMFTCPSPPPPDGGAAVDARGDGPRASEGGRRDGATDIANLDANTDAKACGKNPAEACRTSQDQCIPSSCGCSNGTWVCTADCGGGRNCTDSGTGKADASKAGVACGNTFCTPSEYCCSPTCGECAPQDVVCIAIACEPPSTWACNSDADCRVASDYCTGCDCRALGPGGTLATCPGTGVQCLTDPCTSKVARCIDSQCAVVSAISM
jgi:hypothetical protein